MLDCPIVGVAVDDWTEDQLVDRARTSIEGAGSRWTRRCSTGWPPGSSTWRATSATPPPTGGWQATMIRAIAGVLPGDPALPVRQGGGRAGRRRPDAVGPVVIEKPFGHDLESARASQPRSRAPEGGADLPDRPLPREDGHRGAALPPLRQHDPRAAVEPGLRRLRGDHDGGELRGRGPGPLLRPGGGAAGRGREPPPPGGGGHGHGPAGRAGSFDAEGLAAGRVAGDPDRGSCPLHPGTVRRLPRHPGRGRRVDHRDLRGPAARHRELAVGGAVLHPDRQAPAATQTEVRLVFRRAPRLGFGIVTNRRIEHNQFVVRLDPSTGSQLQVEPSGRPAGPSRSRSTCTSPSRVAKERPRTRCCCTPR